MTAGERRAHIARLARAVQRRRLHVSAGVRDAQRYARHSYVIDARAVAERMVEALPEVFGPEAL
jgi:hypothetical protein